MIDERYIDEIINYIKDDDHYSTTVVEPEHWSQENVDMFNLKVEEY